MADNVTADPGTGGAVFATDDIGGVHYPITKITVGALDSSTLLSGNNGAADAGTIRVTVANDSTGVLATVTTVSTVTNLAQLGGQAISMNTGVRDAGTQRVTIATNDVVPASQSGTWNIGTVTTVTTCSTVTNLAQLGGAAISMNTGVRDAGTQRVTIATNDVVPASQSGTWNITNVSGTVSLPTGAATAANQSTEITALQLIDNMIVAHDAAITGATGLAAIGLNARSTSATAVQDGDAVRALATLLGKQVNLPYAIPANTWSYAAASGGITDTTGVTAKTAAGAGIRNYITAVAVINGHATVSTDVQIRDGASGTVLWRGYAQAAGGGASARFDPPLRGTANTLVEIANGTTGAATYFNLQGFVAAE